MYGFCDYRLCSDGSNAHLLNIIRMVEMFFESIFWFFCTCAFKRYITQKKYVVKFDRPLVKKNNVATSEINLDNYLWHHIWMSVCQSVQMSRWVTKLTMCVNPIFTITYLTFTITYIHAILLGSGPFSFRIFMSICQISWVNRHGMKIVTITPKSEYIIWEIGKYSKDKVANNTQMLICDRFNMSGSHHPV